MSKDRFGFGKNWDNYLSTLNDERIEEAEKSLREWLGVTGLAGKTFLDIGSGSGLFSLAAKRMGADVISFDYDTDSVGCTKKLKDRFYPNDPNWKVMQGDALNESFLNSLGKHDIVYSWGVLHHTGNMYKALDNAGKQVKDSGKLFIAIYNDQGTQSKVWKVIKKTYNKLVGPFKLLISVPYFILAWGAITIIDFIRLKPFDRWKTYKKRRGMNPWYDVVDWVGGYPFEVAKPEDIFEFYHKRGFELEKMATVGGRLGCNQFLFKKVS